jgi:hypothetical protein
MLKMIDEGTLDPKKGWWMDPSYFPLLLSEMSTELYAASQQKYIIVGHGIEVTDEALYLKFQASKNSKKFQERIIGKENFHRGFWGGLEISVIGLAKVFEIIGKMVQSSLLFVNRTANQTNQINMDANAIQRRYVKQKKEVKENENEKAEEVNENENEKEVNEKAEENEKAIVNENEKEKEQN